MSPPGYISPGLARRLRPPLHRGAHRVPQAQAAATAAPGHRPWPSVRSRIDRTEPARRRAGL